MKDAGGDTLPFFEPDVLLRTENRSSFRRQTIPLQSAPHVKGETVPAVHSAILRSELGERLAPDYPFCLVWDEREGRWYVSLRSRSSGADVADRTSPWGRQALKACVCRLKSWPRISDKEPMRRTNRLACIGDFTSV